MAVSARMVRAAGYVAIKSPNTASNLIDMQ